MFSQEEIQQLKEMHLREFGEEIGDQEATENAQVMLDLLTAVYKPKEKDYENQ